MSGFSSSWAELKPHKREGRTPPKYLAKKVRIEKDFCHANNLHGLKVELRKYSNKA